jgi:ubiquitin-conjugating enzyme E2 Q
VHYRVEDVSFFPIIRLSSTPVSRCGPDHGAQPADKKVPLPATAAMTPLPSGPSPAIMTIYRHNFDDLHDASKSDTIVMLIETLPSIRDMRAYLIQQSHSTEPTLKAWKERISPAALGVLRWIIASNRSCIVQVDRCPGQSDIELATSKTRLDQRVSGIEANWVQFRFAQGSPDKEQRFLNALRSQQAILNPKYPTIFAWHGSPLANWHSIIRTGLDFKETLHGRAYGHGVYHAMDQTTSIGYAQVTPGVSSPVSDFSSPC